MDAANPVSRVDSLVDATYDALLAHTREFCRLSNGGFVYVDGSMTLLASPSMSPVASCTAIRTDPAFDASDFLDRATAVFSLHRSDFTLLCRDDQGRDLDVAREAKRRGRTSPWGSMPCLSIDHPVAESGAVSIRTAVSEADVEKWIEITTTAFAGLLTVEGMRADHSPEHVLTVDGLSILLAELDGRPVTSGVMHRMGDLAYIRSVSTLPEARRRGLATALVRRAVNMAFEQGAKHCFLYASHGAETAYEPIGFRSIYSIHHWLPA